MKIANENHHNHRHHHFRGFSGKIVDCFASVSMIQAIPLLFANDEL